MLMIKKKKKKMLMVLESQVFCLPFRLPWQFSDFLAVQWLRLCLPMHRAQVPLFVGELRSYMLCGVAKQKKLSTIDCKTIRSQSGTKRKRTRASVIVQFLFSIFTYKLCTAGFE